MEAANLNEELNRAFWIKTRSEEEWCQILDSWNSATLLSSYFRYGQNYNERFSQILIERNGDLFKKFARIYVTSSKSRHAKAIQKLMPGSIFKMEMERIWKLEESKERIFKVWAAELDQLEFDVALYYFSAYFGANASSRFFLKNKVGADFLFSFFIKDAYDHYVTAASKSMNLKFKWNSDELPQWDLTEHGSNSMRFRGVNPGDRKVELFRDELMLLFDQFAKIEVELINLKYQSYGHEMYNEKKIGDARRQGRMNEPKMAIAWNTFLGAKIAGKKLQKHDSDLLINSIRSHLSLIPAGVSTTAILLGIPEKVTLKSGLNIDLVKWSIALAEFVDFHSPRPLPDFGMFRDHFDKRRDMIAALLPGHKVKSLIAISKDKWISFMTELHGFSNDEVNFVLKALVYEPKLPFEYAFSLNPIIETIDGMLFFSMPLLRRINWLNQMVVSLSHLEAKVGKFISDYREGVVENYLKKLGCEVHAGLKVMIEGKERGEIDALAITSDTIYLFEVKGFDRMDHYNDLKLREVEILHSKATDQLFTTISSISALNVEFSLKDRKRISLERNKAVKSVILANVFSFDGRTPGAIRKASISELGFLCSPELQPAFLETLESFKVGAHIFTNYENLFAQLRQKPELALKILEEGTFWDAITK